MATYSDVAIVAVLDNLGQLHEIDYEKLANQPSSIKNPYAITMFGQSYDGSNAVTVTPAIASSSALGCVKAVTKTSAMGDEVGVDSSGKLYSKSYTIDTSVLRLSTNPVSGNAVYNYVEQYTSNLEDEMSDLKIQIDTEHKEMYTELQDDITDINSAITTMQATLTTHQTSIDSLDSKIDSASSTLESELTTLSTNIATNTSNITALQSAVSSVNSKANDIAVIVDELQAKDIGRFFASEEALLAYIADSSSTLTIGEELYVSNNTQFVYVWDGSSALKYLFSDEDVTSYLTALNPTGSGYFAMNDCQVSSTGISVGVGNLEQGTNGFAFGIGLVTPSQSGGGGVGRYNDTVGDDDIFVIGAGDSDTSKKTVYSVTTSGQSNSYGDIIAYSPDINTSFVADSAKSTVAYKFTKPDNVVVSVDYDTLLSTVTRNDNEVYTFTYNGTNWESASFDFIDGESGEGVYYPITHVGIVLATNDGSVLPQMTYVDGDYFTVSVVQLKGISLLDLYTQVNTGGGLDYDSRIVSLENKTDTINSTITTLSGQVTDMGLEVDSMSTSVSDATSKVSAMDSRVSAVETKNTAIESSVSTLSDKVATNANSITSLQNSLNNVQNSVSTNSSNIGTLQTNMTSMNTSIQSNTTNITGLRSDVDTNTNNISSLTTRMTTAENTISDNKTNISSLTTVVNSYDDSITKLQSDVATNTNSISTNASNITSVQTDITSINETITSLTNRIAALEEKVNGSTDSGT